MGEVHEAVLDDRLALRDGRVHVTASVAGVRLGLPAGRTLQRGGEEERLATLGHLGHDAVDGGLEAHVEHPVCLVEHEDLHVLERDVAALQEILQPTRRGHHDVRPRGELGLALKAHASVHHGHRQRAGIGHALHLIHDLEGQLARGSKHERCGPPRLGMDEVGERNAECQRLAGSGR